MSLLLPEPKSLLSSAVCPPGSLLGRTLTALSDQQEQVQQELSLGGASSGRQSTLHLSSGVGREIQVLIYIPQGSDFKWVAWYKPELLAKGLAVSGGVFSFVLSALKAITSDF